MASPLQGEIWRWESPDAKPRPVLVLTRSYATAILNPLLVAPITSTIRGIPTEVALGQAEGLHHDCVAAVDNAFPAAKAHLVHRIGVLSTTRRADLCEAVRAVVDC